MHTNMLCRGLLCNSVSSAHWWAAIDVDNCFQSGGAGSSSAKMPD